jgi:FMN reductase
MAGTIVQGAKFVDTVYPVHLNYMNAIVVAKYAFVLEKDYLNGVIADDDVIFRLKRLADETVVMVDAMKAVLEAKDEAYPF